MVIVSKKYIDSLSKQSFEEGYQKGLKEGREERLEKTHPVSDQEYEEIMKYLADKDIQMVYDINHGGLTIKKIMNI
jgi:flagellar biosynthesis/type III secretory pathway protein FliH